MKIFACSFIVAALFVVGACANVGSLTVQSYGHFKKMMHMKKTKGVVNLQKAIPSVNGYAVGAIQQGLGEITVIDSKVWLDYGKDGLGNASNNIPADEQAVLLATSQVENWQTIKVNNTFSKKKLFEFIFKKAKQHGLDVNAPFPFLLEGNFDKLTLHVINGQNPEFQGHGGKVTLFRQIKEERNNQMATVVGFYSAGNQGVYTHPGESWHLHAVIRDENIGAHVDDISAKKNVILKLPLINN